MLKRTPQNPYQLHGFAMKALKREMMREAVPNPSTLRSREQYERRKRNKRDPVDWFLVWLPESLIGAITLAMAADHPLLRDMSRDDQRFRKEFARALTLYLLKGVALRSRK